MHTQTHTSLDIQDVLNYGPMIFFLLFRFLGKRKGTLIQTLHLTLSLSEFFFQIFSPDIQQLKIKCKYNCVLVYTVSVCLHMNTHIFAFSPYDRPFYAHKQYHKIMEWDADKPFHRSLTHTGCH